jgi:NitT/TauT family transport system substrate-binding protein
MKNKITIIISILVVIILLFFLNRKEPLTIKVTDPGAIGGALFHIALEKGFFKEQGINVEVIKVQTGDEAIRALVSNSADVALGGIIPYSFLALDNQDVKIFATNAYVGDNQVIVNKDKGINLRGKKIGYTKTTASDIGILQFLRNHGLKESDVELVNMKPLAMAGALESGQIDAYSSWEPHILNGQKLLGDKAYVFNGEGDVYTWHQSLMARSSYIKEHKTELVKFVKAMKESEVFLKDNKDEAIKLAAGHNNVNADTLKTIWSKYSFEIALHDDIYKIIETDLAWANSRREKSVERVPNAKELVDTSILNEIH